MGGRTGSARPAPHLAGASVSRIDLPPEPESARAAREFTRDHLDGLAESLLDTALLLTSELVTNAVLHARTPLQLTVENNGRSIMLAVSDHDRMSPEERPQDAERLDGRGIALVAALSREWGSVAHPAGKTVWCVLDTAPEHQRV
jgi:sigma-B regulation protein RsbU (phosphoserine phosphatase)